MKDTNHIRWDFHFVALVLPQVWDFGALGVPKGSKKKIFNHGHVTSQIDGDDEQKGMTSRTEYK